MKIRAWTNRRLDAASAQSRNLAAESRGDDRGQNQNGVDSRS